MSRYGISMPAVKMRKIVQVGNKLGTVKTSMGPFLAPTGALEEGMLCVRVSVRVSVRACVTFLK